MRKKSKVDDAIEKYSVLRATMAIERSDVCLIMIDAQDGVTETETVNAKAATCTEDGYTGDVVCKTNGETIKKGEVIKATGHQYKDGKCTVCGAADPNYKPGVKTGDESNTALWIVMMASAALLAAAVVVLPRRKRTR